MPDTVTTALPPLTYFAPKQFTDPAEALAQVQRIYQSHTQYLRDCFTAFADGTNFNKRVHGYYPYVQIHVRSGARIDTRLAYGFIETPGIYNTTLTRPDLYDRYYLEQFTQLIKNHKVSIEIGVSDQRIPVHFAFPDGMHLEGGLTPERMAYLGEAFDVPNLAEMDDSIVNGTYEPGPHDPHPLALFTAPRVDFSLHRLRHYTGTPAEEFQNFVIFTNYQFYIDEFVRHGVELMSLADNDEERARRRRYSAFVETGNIITQNANIPGVALPPSAKRPARLPQMPAYHLQCADGSGITMINIGVGPSNAKTITDHVAVLRPHAWLMLGHCAGLRSTQNLGDYVLAHGYVREDHVLDADLPISVPVPALAEMQLALEQAVSDVTGLTGYDRKQVMRTGTVITTDNRNWELCDQRELVRRFSQSRPIALDMESATIAANGFRFRVPYGTLLCVSDKPMHGEIKLPGMADRFYRDRVDQHLKVGMRAMELLRENGLERLHSRKLRGFNEAAFQ